MGYPVKGQASRPRIAVNHEAPIKINASINTMNLLPAAARSGAKSFAL
jgi:hypothetical protein